MQDCTAAPAMYDMKRHMLVLWHHLFRITHNMSDTKKNKITNLFSEQPTI